MGYVGDGHIIFWHYADAELSAAQEFFINSKGVEDITKEVSRFTDLNGEIERLAETQSKKEVIAEARAAIKQSDELAAIAHIDQKLNHDKALYGK